MKNDRVGDCDPTFSDPDPKRIAIGGGSRKSPTLKNNIFVPIQSGLVFNQKKIRIFFKDYLDFIIHSYIHYQFREIEKFNEESEPGKKWNEHRFFGLNRFFIEVAHIKNTINNDPEILSDSKISKMKIPNTSKRSTLNPWTLAQYYIRNFLMKIRKFGARIYFSTKKAEGKGGNLAPLR